MKVLLVNGSSRKKGCTNAALCEVERALQEAGIGTEQFFIGNEALPDCVACRKCRETGRCVFHDSVNEFVEKAKSADGFVFGSPVYFAHPSGRLLAFMDRAFYSGGAAFQFKPAAAVLSARRAGTTASFDVINKYFTICSMPVVSATYWNHVYGAQPEEVAKDKEGLMTMYNIGKNMAWLLKCIALGRENGLPHPDNEKVLTNFIRAGPILSLWRSSQIFLRTKPRMQISSRKRNGCFVSWPPCLAARAWANFRTCSTQR